MTTNHETIVHNGLPVEFPTLREQLEARSSAQPITDELNGYQGQFQESPDDANYIESLLSRYQRTLPDSDWLKTFGAQGEESVDSVLLAACRLTRQYSGQHVNDPMKNYPTDTLSTYLNPTDPAPTHCEVYDVVFSKVYDAFMQRYARSLADKYKLLTGVEAYTAEDIRDRNLHPSGTAPDQYKSHVFIALVSMHDGKYAATAIDPYHTSASQLADPHNIDALDFSAMRKYDPFFRLQSLKLLKPDDYFQMNERIVLESQIPDIVTRDSLEDAVFLTRSCRQIQNLQIYGTNAEKTAALEALRQQAGIVLEGYINTYYDQLVTQSISPQPDELLSLYVLQKNIADFGIPISVPVYQKCSAIFEQVARSEYVATNADSRFFETLYFRISADDLTITPLAAEYTDAWIAGKVACYQLANQAETFYRNNGAPAADRHWQGTIPSAATVHPLFQPKFEALLRALPQPGSLLLAR